MCCRHFSPRPINVADILPLTQRAVLVVGVSLLQGFADEVLTKYNADVREKVFWTFQVTTPRGVWAFHGMPMMC